MLCPNCGFDNPSGTVFCAQCGRSLTRSGQPVGTYLVWQSEDGTPHAVAVTRSMTIGRTDGNDIVIHDSAMSRQHARVEPTGTGIAVVDLGSLNGVYVDDERIVEPTEVAHGGVIRVGRTELTVRVSEATAPSSPSTTGTMRIEQLPGPEAPAAPLPSPVPDMISEEHGAATITMSDSSAPPSSPLPPIEDESADRTLLAPSGTWAIEEVGAGPAGGEGQPIGYLVTDEERIPIYESLTVGRAEGNDLRIQTDRMISRQHAVMRVQTDGLWLEDLNSANGTYLNGTRVTEPLPVVDGDEVRFGSTSFRYEAAPVIAPAPIPEPEPDLSSAETIVAPIPDAWGSPSGFQGTTPVESPPEPQPEPDVVAEAQPLEQGTDVLKAATGGDSGATMVANFAEAEEEDEQLQTLRGSEADLYIRNAVAKEFEAIRRGDTEPFKQEGTDATDQHRLVVNFGAEAGRQFILYKDVTIIGRAAPDADFDIQLNDRAISRPHAKIVKDRDGCVIHDMDSANGTIINYTAEIKEPRRLKDGDIIKLGKTTLVYRVPASSRPDISEPAYDPGVGQIITCFSLKGGVGTTTIAANLAVLLRQLTGQPTLLIDLSTERGAVSVHLNLSPKLTLSDLPSDPAGVEYEVIDSVISHHESGVDVLPAPPSPQTAELVTPALIAAILPIVKDRYKWVVIDTNATFSELNLGVFDQSDLFLLILSPDLASVKVMQSALDVFAALQVPAEKRVIVWNQIHGHPHLDREDVERTLGERIGFSIPFAADAILDSIDRGVPLAIGNRAHPTVAALESFASSLTHVKAVAEAQPRKGGFGQWVQGLLSGVRR